MTGMDLFEAIGQVDEKYLERSEQVYKTVRGRNKRMIRNVACAAVATLIIGAVGFSSISFNNDERKQAVQSDQKEDLSMEGGVEKEAETFGTFEFSLDGEVYELCSAEGVYDFSTKKQTEQEDGDYISETNDFSVAGMKNGKEETDELPLFASEDVVGKYITTITDTDNEELKGCKVYENLSNKDSFIVKMEQGYVVFLKKSQ